MLGLLRHLVAIAVLPFTVAVLIPVWLARRDGTALGLGSSVPQMAVQVTGVLLLAAGLLLFASSLRRFVTEGEGTLAPWDPPLRLVVRGPYRHVRNPMISGVVLVLLGEGRGAALAAAPHLGPDLSRRQCALHPAFGRAVPSRAVRRCLSRVLPTCPATAATAAAVAAGALLTGAIGTTLGGADERPACTTNPRRTKHAADA